MRIPGRKAAINAARWLRSRSQDRALILGYHRIEQPDKDVYGLSVSPSRFAEQMEVLARVAAPARLRDLVTSFGRGELRCNTVVVTFDDGYADALEAALPILERFDVPATIFVVSGYLGREFWWDELERLVLPEAEAGAPAAARGGAAIAAHAADLRVIPDLDRRRGLAAIAGSAPSAGTVRRALNVSELEALARSELIEIGAHTVTHAVLPSLSEGEQRCELQDSRHALEAISGRPIFSFAYPHGAFNSNTIRLVRQAGYTAACASTPDAVTGRADLLALPRFWIGDWSGECFERFLSRWLLD